MTNAKKFAERLIKKYPNRRLYDTQTSAYITLADVRQLVRDNASFAVVDARSGEDITRSILLQIVVEEEAGAAPMLTCQALAQMIRCYGQAMGAHLERSIQSFVEFQDRPPGDATATAVGTREAGTLLMPAQEHRTAAAPFGGFTPLAERDGQSLRS